MEENLQIAKEKVMNKMFYLMIKIAFIFLIPAILAYFLGSFLDGRFNNNERKFIFSCLFLAFIFSWIVVIYLYRKVFKELEDIKKKESEQIKNKQKELEEKIRNN